MVHAALDDRVRKFARLSAALIGTVFLLGCECCGVARAADPCPDAKQEGAVCFAHLTDPHLFSNKGGDNADENSVTFLAASRKLKEIQENFSLDFAVVTGDLEVEELIAKVDPSEDAVDEKLDEGAKSLAEILKASGVHRWLFVPGNNDLSDELSDSLFRYSKLLERTRTKLETDNGKPVQVIDLAGRNLVVGRHAFWGLDNSAFKNNHDESRALIYARDQTARLISLRSKLKQAEERSNFLFLHTPDVEDPFLTWQLEQAGPILTNMDCGERIGLLPRKLSPPTDCRLVGHRLGSHSGWCVTAGVADAWKHLLQDKSASLKGIFAGHLHSPERCNYRARGKSVFVGLDGPSIYVAPPLAIKHQIPASPPDGAIRFDPDAEVAPQGKPKAMTTDPRHARGFQIVQIDADGVVTKRTIYWYDRRDTTE